MERVPVPIRAGGLGLGGGGGAGNMRNGIFQYMSQEDRRRRQAELAINNPHITNFDLYMVSQLPLEQQGAELKRRSEQLQRQEEQRRVWARQTEAMLREFEEISMYQRATLEHLARLLYQPYQIRLPSSGSDHPDIPLTAGGSGNRNSGRPIEVITIDDDDDHDDTETRNSDEELIQQKEGTQKCPFCSKKLSTGHMSRHVHLHCKSARKELNFREDWRCIRDKRK